MAWKRERDSRRVPLSFYSGANASPEVPDIPDDVFNRNRNAMTQKPIGRDAPLKEMEAALADPELTSRERKITQKRDVLARIVRDRQAQVSANVECTGRRTRCARGRAASSARKEAPPDPAPPPKKAAVEQRPPGAPPGGGAAARGLAVQSSTWTASRTFGRSSASSGSSFRRRACGVIDEVYLNMSRLEFDSLRVRYCVKAPRKTQAGLGSKPPIRDKF